MQAIVSFAGVTSSALAFQPSCMIACWAGLSDSVRAFAVGCAFGRTQAKRTNGVYSVLIITLSSLYVIAE